MTLEEKDIEGASLEEPLDSKTVPQLRWWLLCHGVQVPTSEKKAALIKRCIGVHCKLHYTMFIFLCFRIRTAKAEGVGVIDVDGTYLERKRLSLVSANVNVAPLPQPNFPLHGWQSVEESNADDIAKQLLCVLPTTLYTYLAEGVGNARGSMAFRALKRGYVHWASGRISKLEVQTRHPHFTFIRSAIIPSMRSGSYSVKLLLKKRTLRDRVIADVSQASCECAAGLV